MAISFLCVLPSGILLAASNPNYGTTTFFSNKKEKPVLEKPILGAKKDTDKKDDDSNNDDNDDDGGGIVNPGDIFNDIGNTVDAVIDGSVNIINETKKSLFDLQSDFDDNGASDGGGSEEKDEFFIAGPRGESPEYMATIKESNKPDVEFDFEDKNLKVAPKKSKLLFTNKEVAIDMTSQYVSIGFIFFAATASAIAYYYTKKGELKGKKEEDYD